MDRAAVHHDEIGQQLQHRCALKYCPRVGRISILIEASDITDADAMSVVAFTMTSGLANRPASLDRAIEVYNIMVTYVAPAITSRWW